MTTSLTLAAQTLLDLYYQDYAPEDAFIGIDDVKMLMYSEYERMLQDEYQKAKILNRTIEGFGFVTIDSDGIISVQVEVKQDKMGDYIGQLPGKAFSFGDFDAVGTGVQRVRNTDKTCPCSELIRIPMADAWIHCIAPPSGKTYFYTQTVSAGPDCPRITEIVIVGFCHPKNLQVEYLPGLSDGDMQIESRMVKRITDAVLQSLLIARQQVVVDKTNDGNPNSTVATESNPDNIKENP